MDSKENQDWDNAGGHGQRLRQVEILQGQLMMERISLKRRWLCFASLALLMLYVASYFLRSQIYHGQWQGTPIKIRLFHYLFETKLWFPLLWLEEAMSQQEFHGQVRSGASLPPLDPAYTETQ